MSEIKKIELLVKERLNQYIDSLTDVTEDQLREIIVEEVLNMSKATYLSFKEKENMIVRIFNSMRRLDILQPLLEDEEITEIMINAPNEIFIEKCGEIKKLKAAFENQEQLEDLIHNIVGRVNRAVNETSPIVDARLEDGSRVNVVFHPVAIKGPIMTIRKFPSKPLTIEDLIAKESISPEASDFLETLIKCRYNLFISGGTATGKTTFLNILSNFIPKDERIITIEDSAELQLKRIDNLVSLEVRNANSAGKGEITIRDLIKTSLRMRPDRIIVGEVRGGEAFDMLQAMNTGHEGSISTGHANSAENMLNRLEAMVLSATDLPVNVIRKQIASSLEIIIHLSKFSDGKRKVMEIKEIIGVEKDDYVFNTIFTYDVEKDSLIRVGTLEHKEKMKKCGAEIYGP